MGRAVSLLLVGVAMAFLSIQLVPYGRDHTNPPTRVEPAWDSPKTRALAVKTCFDCHSNETVWPWYSNVAPMSWLVQRDVEEGREELNFSEWNRAEEDGDDAAETVSEGSMPPLAYVIPHPEARLSSSEKAALIRGLELSLGGGEDGEEEDGGDRRGSGSSDENEDEEEEDEEKDDD